MKSQQQIEKIKSKIVESYQPEKIILFGSRARGKATRESDYDFLILKKTTQKPQYRIFDLLSCLPSGANIDAVIYTPEEFALGKRRHWSLIEEVLKDGKVLYENA